MYVCMITYVSLYVCMYVCMFVLVDWWLRPDICGCSVDCDYVCGDCVIVCIDILRMPV